MSRKTTGLVSNAADDCEQFVDPRRAATASTPGSGHGRWPNGVSAGSWTNADARDDRGGGRTMLAHA
eukprot:3211678-Pyramimonas_sp.AAC.1